ncbi:unnamed protein product [Rhizopus stolonifer]
MKEIKVKVFYVLRNSNATRLSTFTTKRYTEEKSDVSLFSISLRDCLLSICFSSPDIICKDHDLSVYTANFPESRLNKKTFIWEGHGLLSWILEKQQTQIYGEAKDINKTIVEVHISLQPTMKWARNDYFFSLNSKSFEQVISYIETPSHSTCNCYTAYDLYPQFTPPQKKTLNTLPPISSFLCDQKPSFTQDHVFNIPHTRKNMLSFPLAFSTDAQKPTLSCNLNTTVSSSPSPEAQYAPRTILHKGRKDAHIVYFQTPEYSKKTDVRTYHEVAKDDQGVYLLPVEIDSWTVVDLGTVVYDRPAYHNQRYIYPINYTVRKWYRSMVDPKTDTQYTCRILENGKEPLFEVTADDCQKIYSGPTPTTVWTIIVR